MKEDSMMEKLASIPVSTLSHDDWLHVGMALKEEGYPCSVWEDWSRDDERFRNGECQRRWNTFNGDERPVTGATITMLAKQYGWKPGDGSMDWDDYIGRDSAPVATLPLTPVQQLASYIRAVFRSGDHVGYVTRSTEREDGRITPADRGIYNRTADQLLDSLTRYPDDISMTVGDWNKEGGAWIRFNALDGNGVKDSNVTSFRFALIESDSMDKESQEKLLRSLNLPIAAMVDSGGKSIHAIVHVDAPDEKVYRERIGILYGKLKSKGLVPDEQNRNPSRLSRMPGVTRNGNMQRLIATDIGAPSWDEWISWIEMEDDSFPEPIQLSEYRDKDPVLPPELISGVLRCGHKMIIAGPSKAGKSFFLMELCVSLAEGIPWVGFPVRKGKVLYINLEIDPESCIDRFKKIYRALGSRGDNMENITIWNLRGHATPLDKLVPKVLEMMKGAHYSAVIFDPIYKLSMGGDENSASDMGIFCNQFDKICAESGASVIYCHHHSKGAQGGKKAIDRSSGSGVFARDPDAVLDLIELDIEGDIKDNVRDGAATAWRLEGTLREFPSFPPKDMWFEYPVHRVDMENLSSAHPEGSAEANLARSGKRTSREERHNSLTTAFDLNEEDGAADVKDMAEYIGTTPKSIRRYIKEFSDEFSIENSIVRRL